MPPFSIDVSSPANDALVSAFPANERAHRTTLKNIITVEHDEGSGHHVIGDGSIATRDAITDWVNGAIWRESDLNTLQIRNAGAFVDVFGYGYGTTASKPASPRAGFAYLDTDLGAVEVYDGTSWQQLSGAVVRNVVTDVVGSSDSFFPALGAFKDVGLTVSIAVPNDGNSYDILVDANVSAHNTSGAGTVFYSTLVYKNGSAAWADKQLLASPLPTGGFMGSNSHHGHFMGVTAGNTYEFRLVATNSGGVLHLGSLSTLTWPADDATLGGRFATGSPGAMTEAARITAALVRS